jgi:hypothetical protein
LDVYSSPTLHNILFAGLTTDALPPPEYGVLIDGELHGIVLDAHSEEETRILDFTPQSVAYTLSSYPKVCILGEIGGVNAWLALRADAAEITWVQGNPKIMNMVNKVLDGTGLENHPNITFVNSYPRHYIQTTDESFDIIHFSSTESMPSLTGGMYGFHENYLLTVNALMHSFENLTQDGFITITRVIQVPPRDNIKIAYTAIEALEGVGVDQPQNHFFQCRNYLAVSTIISKKPLGTETISAFLSLCDDLGLDVEYYPGIESSEIIQKHRIPGPEGKK